MLTEDEFTGFLHILGGRIKAIRKQKKLTMRDIMISARYYDAQWRKYESGGSMNVRALLQIALRSTCPYRSFRSPWAMASQER